MGVAQAPTACTIIVTSLLLHRLDTSKHGQESSFYSSLFLGASSKGKAERRGLEPNSRRPRTPVLEVGLSTSYLWESPSSLNFPKITHTINFKKFCSVDCFLCSEEATYKVNFIKLFLALDIVLKLLDVGPVSVLVSWGCCQK